MGGDGRRQGHKAPAMEIGRRRDIKPVEAVCLARPKSVVRIARPETSACNEERGTAPSLSALQRTLGCEEFVMKAEAVQWLLGTVCIVLRTECGAELRR